METDPTRRRLLELASERGASLAALSRMIGKNPTYLQQFVRKGSPRRLEERDRGQLARFFGVDEAELGREEENSSASGESADASWYAIPRLSLGASAGGGAIGGEEGAFDSIGFSERWLRAMGLRPDRLAALAVQGDSMEPGLRDGDEILVERGKGPFRDGIHVVRLDGTLLVKRLDFSRAGIVVLISDNPAYRPVECASGEVDIIGRVVWKGGRV